MKNVTLIAIALLLGANVFGQTLQDAQRELENENYFKAKQILYKLYNDGTTDKAVAAYYLGNTYLKSDDADSARLFYKMVFKPDAKSALGYVANGRLALLSKNTVDAKQNFDMALKYTKFKDANIYLEVGDAYFRPNVIDISAAISNLEAGTALDNKNTTIMLELGDAYLSNSSNDPTMGGKAMTQYQSAREVNKNLSIAWIKEGRLDVQGQIYDQAIEVFKKALAIDQNYPIVHKELGEVYYYTKQYDKMIDEYQKYVALSPGDSKARTVILEMLMRNKAYDKVVDEATKAIKTDPANFDFMRYLIYSDLELKRYKEGYDQSIIFFATPNVKPKTRDIVSAARLSAAVGDTAKANDYFNQALSVDSNNCDLLTEYSKSLYSSKRYAEATKAFAAKKTKCGDLKALDYYYLGRAYLLLDDSINADSSFAAFIDKSPTTPDGYYWRARTNLKIGRLDKGDFFSYPYYQKYVDLVEPLLAANAAKYKSNMVEAYDYIGLYYAEKIKDKAKAKEFLNKALELDPTDQNTIDFLKTLK